MEFYRIEFSNRLSGTSYHVISGKSLMKLFCAANIADFKLKTKLRLIPSFGTFS